MTTQPKKCSARELIIKACLNDEEAMPFRQRCAALGTTMSARVRTLIRNDVSEANRISARSRSEWPKHGPVRALFPAARGRFGGAPVPRLRL